MIMVKMIVKMIVKNDNDGYDDSVFNDGDDYDQLKMMMVVLVMTILDDYNA